MSDRYDADALIDFAAGLLTHGGLEPDKARVTGEILVEGDLLGHTTHGLALLGQNLDELAAGRMATRGGPIVLAEATAAQTWDGRRLPGPWLVRRAADWASTRARESGIASVAIRRACHIGCLAAYLDPIAERGQMLIVTSSDPSTASVAPFGGTQRVYTPNPLAAGWPTPDGPVLLDVSMSCTTNGMIGRLRAEGRQFEHPWLLDGAGQPTRDPDAFFADPPGSVLPIGGVACGHKGYALGLLIEALTSALGGYGRADGETAWGASVFVLVIDPARFGGTLAFERETGWMADAVHANAPVAGGGPVRLPGERARATREAQMADGVTLHRSIPPALASLGQRAGIAPPTPRA